MLKVDRDREARSGRYRTRVPLLFALALGAACAGVDAPSGSSPPDRMAVLAADDARSATPEDLQTLVGGTFADDPEVRIAAVRALGRLERPDMVGAILELLTDPHPGVRATASFAAAQAIRDTAGSPVVTAALRRVAEEDPDPVVRGRAAADLGRIPLEAATPPAEIETQLASTLAAALREGAGPEPARGAARGLESLTRRRADPAADPSSPLRRSSVESLSRAAAESPDPRTRRYAAATLVRAGALGDELAAVLQENADPEVRRRAVGAAPRLESPARAIERAVADEALIVRVEGWRQAGRALPGDAACRLASERLERLSTPESLQAIALLASCPDASAQLERLASGLAGFRSGDWHTGAAALLALAGVDPVGASGGIEAAAVHPVWEVRLRAARALDRLLAGASPGLTEPRALDLLERLANDREANVRVAALRALAEHSPERARGPALAALDRDEPELLMTAAGIVGDDDAAAPAERLLAALERSTDRRSETLRDARIALLEAFGRTADGALAPRLEPYLRDFDPEVAASAAELHERLTGEPVEPRPEPLAPVPFPDERELERLASLDWVLTVRERGDVVLRLWPWRAPTNAARFARLAERGEFDGLTFHRVVANFVIQGLSPGANEYAGYPRYSRDEITPAAHLRGTVGLSTRGRDTGDGQVFINLVDNDRLDYEYTLLGEVVAGMDVVERILEGDVVERVVAR